MYRKGLQGPISPEMELQRRAAPISQCPQTSRMRTLRRRHLTVGLGSTPAVCFRSWERLESALSRSSSRDRSLPVLPLCGPRDVAWEWRGEVETGHSSMRSERLSPQAAFLNKVFEHFLRDRPSR